MADEQDDSQKTEEPTQKRLDDAREKGDVPRSQEVKHATMLLAGLIVVALMAGMITLGLLPMMTGMLGNAHEFTLDGQGTYDLTLGIYWQLTLAVGAPLALLFGFALAGGLIQGRPVFSWEKVKPTLDKISPIAGFKRLFGGMAWVEFAKTLVKFGIITAAALYVIWPDRSLIEQSVAGEPKSALQLMMALSVKLFLAVVIAALVLAVLDFFYQRFAYLKRQRMSRQDLKDEMKQSEGDPHIKARIRMLRMERARKRMMAAVPTADVVITNPTHFAVALKYDHGKMAAPSVVAKGVDSLALRIRTVAGEHQVPIVENPPLARALYASVDIDEEIPAEHYKAVAEVISYVMKLRGKMPARTNR
jgi:flagellar biosynthesis protein FlhB